jgi:hypothetical protein
MLNVQWMDPARAERTGQTPLETKAGRPRVAWSIRISADDSRGAKRG